MEKTYITPEMEITQFDSEDVITTSSYDPGSYMPWDNEGMPY